MRISMLTTAAFLAAFSVIGCNRETPPKLEQVEQAAQVTATKPDWKLVTLHIDGFKKSKSGGT